MSQKASDAVRRTSCATDQYSPRENGIATSGPTPQPGAEATAGMVGNPEPNIRERVIRILWEKQFEGSPWAGKCHLIRTESLAQEYGPFADILIAEICKSTAPATSAGTTFAYPDDDKELTKQLPKFAVYFEPRPDGGIRISSDDLPGLILSADNPHKCLSTVWHAVLALAEHGSTPEPRVSPPATGRVIFPEDDWPDLDVSLADWFNSISGKPEESDWDGLMSLLASRSSPPAGDREAEKLAEVFFNACCDHASKNGWPSSSHGSWHDLGGSGERGRACFIAGMEVVLSRLRAQPPQPTVARQFSPYGRAGTFNETPPKAQPTGRSNAEATCDYCGASEPSWNAAKAYDAQNARRAFDTETQPTGGVGELVERLRDASQSHGRDSIENGCAGCGVSSNLTDQAADMLVSMDSRLTDTARAHAATFKLAVHHQDRAEAAQARVAELVRQIDPAQPPTNNDWLLSAVHADIQNSRPDVTVEHRNIVLLAVARTIRAALSTTEPTGERP